MPLSCSKKRDNDVDLDHHGVCTKGSGPESVSLPVSDMDSKAPGSVATGAESTSDANRKDSKASAVCTKSSGPESVSVSVSDMDSKAPASVATGAESMSNVNRKDAKGDYG